MPWLNYHHLFYFWTVAREGSIARAAKVLRLTEPTIGAQIHALEDALGEKVFERVGRSLALTESGQLAYQYATDIFTLGQELQAAVSGATLAKPQKLRHPGAPVREAHRPRARPRDLLRAVHVDLADEDAETQNQLLGECDVTIFGADRLAARYRPGFPASLDKAPFLLPSSGSPLRQSLDRWMEDLSVRPWVRGTFADGALLKAFGRAGVGLFAAPSAIEEEIKEEYNVRVVGRVDAILERFFVV